MLFETLTWPSGIPVADFEARFNRTSIPKKSLPISGLSRHSRSVSADFPFGNGFCLICPTSLTSRNLRLGSRFNRFISLSASSLLPNQIVLRASASNASRPPLMSFNLGWPLILVDFLSSWPSKLKVQSRGWIIFQTVGFMEGNPGFNAVILYVKFLPCWKCSFLERQG